MYELYDTFNNQTISRHRTIANAVKARKKLDRQVSAANGKGSYIPTCIFDSEGEPVNSDHPEYDEVLEAEGGY